MKTRELASKLRQLAEFFDSRPEFTTEMLFVSSNRNSSSMTFYDKEKFVQAVKSIGNATKKYTDGDAGKLLVTASEVPFEVEIYRDKVCTKKVTYDCEPLFSAEEVEVL